MGIIIIAKSNDLHAYLSSDMDQAHHLHEPGFGSGVEIPFLNCGEIDDSGADDTEYFEKGYK